jgi:hypothetical protein
MSEVEVSALVRVRFAGAGSEAVELAEQLRSRGFDVQWSEVGEARAVFSASVERRNAVPVEQALDLMPWALGGRTLRARVTAP